MTSDSRLTFGLLFYSFFGLCLVTIHSQFIEVPRDQLHVGFNLTLKCLLDDDALESHELSSYNWFLNNKKIISNGKHYEQNNNELLIMNANRHLSGYYSCVVEFAGSGAKLETPHELITFVSDKQQQHDENPLESPCGFRIPKLCRNKRNKNEEDFVIVNSREGASITLKCHLTEVEDGSGVRWLKDGNEVIFDAEIGNVINSNRFTIDKTNYQITISDISMDDAGIYDCALYDKQQWFKIKSAKRYELQVDVGFKFTTKPIPTKNLEIGTTGKVHCKAAGSSKIYWVKDALKELPHDVEDNNGTLIFNSVTLAHKGNYTCIASNDVDNIKTSVEVRIVPVLKISPPESLEIVEMQSVFLDCVATGSPQPTITWSHNGDEISNEGRFKIYENGTLQLQEARQDDGGSYECMAGSSAGFKRAESLLIVKGMDSHSSFEDANQEGNFIMSKTVLLTCLVALIYISLVIALMIWCRHKRNKSRADNDDLENKNDDTASDGDEENKPLNHETKSSRNNKIHQNSREKPKKLATSPSSTLIIDHLMISHDRLTNLTKLGRGQFGEVLSGKFDNESPSNVEIVNENGKRVDEDENEIQQQQRRLPLSVLVKSMSRIKDESHFVEFRRQIDLFRAIDSLHVVKLLALSFEKDHHFMVLENHRNLKEYLMENSELNMQQLIQYSKHVVMGLDAIAKSKLTHRDIALRNCVISLNNSTVKLSSIALCKDKHAGEYMKREGGKVIALRHQAPEILLQSATHTTASDIYSCAIAIWEIINVGALPFDDISNEEFIQMVEKSTLDFEKLFANGKCSQELRKSLSSCWSINPVDRPSPENLLDSLNFSLTTENGDI